MRVVLLTPRATGGNQGIVRSWVISMHAKARQIRRQNWSVKLNIWWNSELIWRSSCCYSNQSPLSFEMENKQKTSKIIQVGVWAEGPSVGQQKIMKRMGYFRICWNNGKTLARKQNPSRLWWFSSMPVFSRNLFRPIQVTSLIFLSGYLDA